MYTFFNFNLGWFINFMASGYHFGCFETFVSPQFSGRFIFSPYLFSANQPVYFAPVFLQSYFRGKEVAEAVAKRPFTDMRFHPKVLILIQAKAARTSVQAANH